MGSNPWLQVVLYHWATRKTLRDVRLVEFTCFRSLSFSDLLSDSFQICSSNLALFPFLTNKKGIKRKDRINYTFLSKWFFAYKYTRYFCGNNITEMWDSVSFYKAISYTQTLLVKLYGITMTTVIKGLGYGVFTFSTMIFLNTGHQMLTSVAPGIINAPLSSDAGVMWSRLMSLVLGSTFKYFVRLVTSIILCVYVCLCMCMLIW